MSTDEIKQRFGPRWAYRCLDSILGMIPDLDMTAQEAEAAGIPRSLHEKAARVGSGGPCVVVHTLPQIKTLNPTTDHCDVAQIGAVLMFGVRRAWGRMEYRLFARVRIAPCQDDLGFAQAAAFVEQELAREFAEESGAWLAAEWPSYLAAIERRA
jgi:hypothetical protein